jgi:hypothetical protein
MMIIVPNSHSHNHCQLRQEKPSGSPSATPGTSAASPQPAGTGGDGNGTGFYGKYRQAAAAQLAEYTTKYPTLKIYPPKLLKPPYPPNVLCSRVKQPPFVVFMAVFGRVPDNQNSSIMGTSTAPSDDVKVFADKDTPENNQLGNDLAKKIAIEEVNTADMNRAVADKGRPVLYQYQVQFDPATCKK